MTAALLMFLLPGLSRTGLALLAGLAFAELHCEGWVMFAAVMRLLMARDAGTLSPAQTLAGKALLAVGFALDVVLNVLATVWLLQPPFLRTSRDLELKVSGPGEALRVYVLRRQWLLSQRLEHNVFSGEVTGWRKDWSERFRRTWLDNIDPRGVHRS